MNAILNPGVTRRSVLAGTGALVLSFSMRGALAQEAQVKPGDESSNFQPQVEAAPELPGSLAKTPKLDAWIRVAADGKVTVFTGKAELGQGIKTALMQVAAEELEVPFETLTLVTPDTGLTPNEGYTAGSHSMQDSGTAIRNAAAQVREILIGQAAQRLGVPAEQLHAEKGAVVGPDGKRIGYGALVADDLLNVDAQPTSKLKSPDSFTEMGTPRQRVDIPGKVTGGQAYVQDMRLDGMLHGRVVRPPSPGAKLVKFDDAAAKAMPGVVQVVRNGSFIGVLAEKEWQAIKAMRVLSLGAGWEEHASLPDIAKLPEVLKGMTTKDGIVKDAQKPVQGVRSVEASYTRPYQVHGSIGPSCAVAQVKDGVTTVWTHTQGVFPDQGAIAEMLGQPVEKVRCIHVEGSGCYGHNGADDSAADAALLAQVAAGRPVRVQWMREQEHAWEPFSPGMVTKVHAQLDASGNIVDWNYELWSNNHSTRPGSAGALLPAQYLEKPFQPDEQELKISPEGNGDRNSVPLYAFPSQHVVWHWIKDMPLRASALRGLGAYMNVFTIETFMDQLALEAGADPVEYRLRHLQDERARAVVSLAAEKFGWQANQKAPRDHGYGFAFARYKNLAAYCAVAMEVEVERDTGRVRLIRGAAAVDTGEIANPDGVRNQVEGGIIQAASWALYEGVTFNDTRVTSVDWSTYPILRFDALPGQLDVHLIPRPGTKFLGAGECGQGPGGAAVGNAVFNAIGARLYDLPLSRERIKAAIGA
ncbi:molybdopterin-dependent oxidoreductase [Aurantimonas sp. MSK8Z-1]|uniref:xanthine dehydrogenase family protein molybdopterin-binding subunit n=1 Tax=Mangrovibrevibacter kandeliae TaxID=2968473 RepID=UPI0021190FFB|nr:molybdopterin cofactor-binding domain-containing protein [Aurantimonas sp. MSK8Z-1]MCW4115069.1 molybdopterin-dependent oxidoreductase [Aurantimonas sp. MSK8Z-1]